MLLWKIISFVIIFVSRVFDSSSLLTLPKRNFIKLIFIPVILFVAEEASCLETFHRFTSSSSSSSIWRRGSSVLYVLLFSLSLFLFHASVNHSLAIRRRIVKRDSIRFPPFSLSAIRRERGFRLSVSRFHRVMYPYPVSDQSAASTSRGKPRNRAPLCGPGESQTISLRNRHSPSLSLSLSLNVGYFLALFRLCSFPMCLRFHCDYDSVLQRCIALSLRVLKVVAALC